MTTREFQTEIRRWYRADGRYSLPWRKTHDPYRILVSEMMLQQTQVSRVIPKYRAFVKAFPSVRALDATSLRRVLSMWRGLGYNRRASYLKQAAHIIATEYNGAVPNDPDELARLPGIGQASAGAIAAFAFGRQAAFIETNIRRVFIYFFFRGRDGVRDAEILKKIEATMPRRNIREWYYALMDYGALEFRNKPNPNRTSAHYTSQSAFRGSRRQVRGRVLKEVLAKGVVGTRELRKRMKLDPILKNYADPESFTGVLDGLARDGLISRARGRITIAK